MSLIRTYIPDEDKHGHWLNRAMGRPHLTRPQALSRAFDAPIHVIPRAMALEVIRPTDNLNTGERILGVLWGKMEGIRRVMVRRHGSKAIYVPIHCFKPLKKDGSDDRHFPHFKRRAA